MLGLALLAGTLPYFLADEWLTRGEGAGRGLYALSKRPSLVSLGIAVAFDFGRLFFLLIIVPVIIPFMLVYGLFSVWIYRRTRFPLVGGRCQCRGLRLGDRRHVSAVGGVTRYSVRNRCCDGIVTATLTTADKDDRVGHDTHFLRPPLVPA